MRNGDREKKNVCVCVCGAGAIGSQFVCLALGGVGVCGYILIASWMVVCSASHTAACFMGEHAQARTQSSSTQQHQLKWLLITGSCVISARSL